MEKQSKNKKVVTNMELIARGLPIKWVDEEKDIVCLFGTLISERDRAIMRKLGFVNYGESKMDFGWEDEKFLLPDGKVRISQILDEEDELEVRC